MVPRKYFLLFAHQCTGGQDVRIRLAALVGHPVGIVEQLVIAAQIHGSAFEFRFVMIQIRAHVHQVLTAAHFGADKLHMGFLPFPGQPLIDVPDLFPVHLDLADGNLGPVFRFHKLEQVHQTLCRISFKQLVHMEPAILPCLDLQLPHQTGNRFRYRIV